MEELAKKVWRDFNKLKEDPRIKSVIVDTVPILYFGDYESYKNSNIKIVTVSLNPSNQEFLDKGDTEYRFFRFPEAEGLKGKKELSSADIEKYIKSLNMYFETGNSYDGWFDNNRKYLFDILNASYYNRCENRVIHIDIATPIATDPTWGRLNKEVQQVFMETEKGTWEKLIEILAPDIMLMSLNDKFIKTVDRGLYKKLKENEERYLEEGNTKKGRYCYTADYSCGGKTIKVMDIITANVAFQFTNGGVGYGKFCEILKKWRSELKCQR